MISKLWILLQKGLHILSELSPISVVTFFLDNLLVPWVMMSIIFSGSRVLKVLYLYPIKRLRLEVFKWVVVYSLLGCGIVEDTVYGFLATLYAIDYGVPFPFWGDELEFWWEEGDAPEAPYSHIPEAPHPLIPEAPYSHIREIEVLKDPDMEGGLEEEVEMHKKPAVFHLIAAVTLFSLLYMGYHG